MHPNRTLAAVAALMLAVLVAACGGSSASATPTAQPSIAASLAASAEPSAGASSGAVSDLEELIPDEIGGITLQKFSMQGDEFVNSGSATAETQDFLEGLGVSTDDVSVAAGFGVAPDTGDGVAVFVFRAIGAGTDRLITVFQQATDEARETPLDWQPATVSGKAVFRATDPEQGGQIVYLYAIDDTLFFLAATQDDHAAQALAALP